MVVMLLVIPAPRIFLPSPKVAARARDRHGALDAVSLFEFSKFGGTCIWHPTYGEFRTGPH